MTNILDICSIRKQVANSLSSVLNNDFFLFGESLVNNRYRATWKDKYNNQCVTCEVTNTEIPNSPIQTTIYTNIVVESRCM